MLQELRKATVVTVGRLGSHLVPVVSAVVVRRGDGAARVPDRGQVRKL